MPRNAKGIGAKPVKRKHASSGTKVSVEPIYGDDAHMEPGFSGSTNSPRGSQQTGAITLGTDQNTETVDSRPTRKKWPKDRGKKLTSMSKAMPEFLAAYFGNVVAIASAMSVTPVDVREVINDSPELIELQEIAVTSVEALLLDHGLYVALNSKNIAGVKWLLETKFPDKYGKGKSMASKNKGFTAPTDDPDDLESVLEIKDKK